MDQLRNRKKEQAISCGSLPPPFDRWDPKRCCLQDHADGRLVNIELPDGRTAAVCSFAHVFVSYVRVYGPDAGNELLGTLNNWHWFLAAAGAGQPTIFKALARKYGELTLTPEEIDAARASGLSRTRNMDGTIMLSSTPPGFEAWKGPDDDSPSLGINPFTTVGAATLLLTPELMVPGFVVDFVNCLQGLLAWLPF